MPSRNYSQGKPWRARIRVHGKDLYLGCYTTYAEAKEVEQAARKRYRQMKPGWNIVLRDRDERGRFVA